VAAALLLTVRFHEGRYHGRGDWPPAPARLFQALVAGAARGRHLPDDARNALGWLEAQDPPTMAAPLAEAGQEVTLFVPNNDLDAVGGDPARVSELRVGKRVRPAIFDPEIPLLYLWRTGDASYAGEWVMQREKAAYRGGCQSLPEPPEGAIRHGRRYHDHPASPAWIG